MPAFDSFFSALWGHPPYPWQRRLAALVIESGWPRSIGVPTGAGKTAALDIAVFALAAEAHRPPTELSQPRRIVLVVDRRTVVDQAFERAAAIRDALLAATDGPLRVVADRLRGVMGHAASAETPLALALLRGGLPRDDGWVRRPDQPLIAISTVDQVGARLLFRGYGVRSTMQSVHAGLLGADTLFLLDEVHLARPFEETLSAIEGRYRAWAEVPLPRRGAVVRLSATQSSTDGAPPFDLDDADRAHPHLSERLRGGKRVRRVSVASLTHSGRPARPAKNFQKAIERTTSELLEAGRRCVGVVLNRVDSARAASEALRASGRCDVVLLTGRMRPCDREAHVREVVRRAGPDRKSEVNDARPFVCVATQCIEAGADLDFDGLVTELASVDALVQRFGRVNRTGRREGAEIRVLCPKLKGEDPIYGAALEYTDAWLSGLEDAESGWDAATSKLSERLQSAPDAAWPPHKTAAVLIPPHLDLLAQTGPCPEPDPDPAHYLHGLEPVGRQVRIVWRADISTDAQEAAAERLDALPPATFEALSLPMRAARQWLADAPVESFGDAGAAPESSTRERSHTEAVGFMRGKDAWIPATVRDLRPEAVIVVPAGRGGLAHGNFDPSASEAVRDHGDIAATLRSGRPTLRLDPRTLPPLDAAYALPRPPADDDGKRTPRQARDEALAWLRGCTGAESPILARLHRSAMEPGGRGRLAFTAVDGAWVVTGPRLPREALLGITRERGDPNDTALSADAHSSAIGAAVSLEDHLRGVEAWARSLAERCGLPDPIVDDIALAGRWHDLGKADPRFQVLLHGGDEIAAAGGELLAKSGMHPGDKRARERARHRARVPEGFRHEMASVQLLQSSPTGIAILGDASDPDLVLHLIASHHGHARPFAPPEDHRDHPSDLRVEASLGPHHFEASADHRMDAAGSGVAERYFRVQRRYGWWGLAWLEAILRLADHRRSEAESQDAGGAAP